MGRAARAVRSRDLPAKGPELTIDEGVFFTLHCKRNRKTLEIMALQL
jgi:hypothetical protein